MIRYFSSTLDANKEIPSVWFPIISFYFASTPNTGVTGSFGRVVSDWGADKRSGVECRTGPRHKGIRVYSSFMYVLWLTTLSQLVVKGSKPHSSLYTFSSLLIYILKLTQLTSSLPWCSEHSVTVKFLAIQIHGLVMKG